MECYAERIDAAYQPRTRANLCARCQWGDNGCAWGLPEFARGGWRLVQGPAVRYERCESYSPSVDDPAL